MGQLLPRGRPWTRTTPAASRSLGGRAVLIPLGLAALVIIMINFLCIAHLRITAIASYLLDLFTHHSGGFQVITFIIIVGLRLVLFRSSSLLGTMNWAMVLKSLGLIGPHKLSQENAARAILGTTAPSAVLKLVSGCRPAVGVKVTTYRENYASTIETGTARSLARFP